MLLVLVGKYVECSFNSRLSVLPPTRHLRKAIGLALCVVTGQQLLQSNPFINFNPFKNAYLNVSMIYIL
jgi:hypothetical protein